MSAWGKMQGAGTGDEDAYRDVCDRNLAFGYHVLLAWFFLHFKGEQDSLAVNIFTK